ncbi:YjbH domain-containing protein [Ramlibacter sp. MMS24-I3-19]|uniref:YjbH domain-containing protein n=1 Tax=Ramlibacter sp. MMS24-I3-19 TaxID=3416606 RepID=UPI003CFD7026
MRSSSATFSLLALGLATNSAWAVDTTLTSAGYTGLGITPTAQILGWGRAATSYENQLAGNPARVDGHNLVLGFGLLPNLEAAGRLATNTIHDSCFSTSGCGARDLSASMKAGIGLDAARRWSIGVGATDVGGSVTYFRTYYGALTYDNGPFQATAGAAKRKNVGVNGSRAPLDGAFASLAWQPLPLVRGHVEYSDRNAWAGVRLFAPEAWLPEGWSLSAGANRRLSDTALTKRSWWDASLSIPLYKVPAMPGTSKAALPPLQRGQQPQPSYEARAGAVAPPTITPAPVQAVPATDVQLQALANVLEAKGLEDISVGRMPDGTIAVRANNGSYGWNAVDAVGVALGAIARGLSDSKAGYRLIVTQRQVPLVAVTGQADCLREWIEQPTNSCTAGQLSTPGSAPLEPLHEGAVWVVHEQKPASRTVRINVSPVLRTNIGTEVGAVDFALGAAVDAQLPLWTARVSTGVSMSQSLALTITSRAACSAIVASGPAPTDWPSRKPRACRWSAGSRLGRDCSRAPGH